MSAPRNMLTSTGIPILKVLKNASKIAPFQPYMMDKHLQVEKRFPGFENFSNSAYNMKDFAADNEKVMTWFSQLQERFNQWQNQHYPDAVKSFILEPTGSRSFGASYTESDLECAIVSENFEDFLNFTRFLNTNYHSGHTFTALKTLAGLPLLIIKSESGFACPELSKLYSGKTLPQLEVTFRHPSVHQIIQTAGKEFFAGLTSEELESYVFNKRYIELMMRQLPKDASVDGKPLKVVLEEFKGALADALKCLPAGKLQDTPDFNKDVFASAATARLTSHSIPANYLQTSLVTKSNSLFNKPEEFVTKQQAKWLALISKETDEHCAHLTSIGLADRASYFKVRSFIYQDCNPASIDISRFKQTMAMPELVDTFNTEEKNTLFANPESTQEQEIKRALDIRLYPTIRRLIAEQGANVFLGSKTELQAYTGSIKEKIIIEIEIPSSVKFYIALNNAGNMKVYLSGLVSHENLLQQLITLKLAGIDTKKIEIRGNTQQYKSICKEDLEEFEEKSGIDIAKKNVLIVAGCTLEELVCSTLDQMFVGEMSKERFTGQLVSLTYVKSEHAPNLGFIILNLNYGEICEEQISTILERFNCIGVYSGSAAGYIPTVAEEKFPDIGTRIPVHSARHHSGEVVLFDKLNKNQHLHVPTIFVETDNWLKKAKESGATTVDVETFYILRAIQHYQKANPHLKLQTDIGVFISDYVGEKPLRSYDRVFSQYPLALQNFVKQVLVSNITSSYNNNRITIPKFASQYFSLKTEVVEISQKMKKEAVVDAIGNLWDQSEFSRRVHTPVSIGSVKDQARFSTQAAPRCLHLPIQLPGSDIRIPVEYQHYSDALQQILNFEASINPGWKDLYAYLTVDQSFVARANSQRVPGPHVDGIPRDRDNPRAQLIDHAYLVTDAIPTMFYAQQFDMNTYDPKIHHFFAIFRALADESRTITVKPFEISLMNAYSVHTPTNTLEDVNRTFIRLEFSTIKFDRVGNSVNPHFETDNQYPDYPFNYVPRPIPENLFVPPSVYLNKPISNEDYSYETVDKFGRLNLQAIFTQSNKFKLKHSDYHNLDLIAEAIMNKENQGIVINHQGIPHAFALYKIENKTVKLDTLFTLEHGKGQEMLLYALKILSKVADKLSIQAGLEEGATPITIAVNDNNDKMLTYFLRAAQLAKLQVNIERPDMRLQLKHN